MHVIPQQANGNGFVWSRGYRPMLSSSLDIWHTAHGPQQATVRQSLQMDPCNTPQQHSHTTCNEDKNDNGYNSFESGIIIDNGSNWTHINTSLRIRALLSLVINLKQ